MSDGEIIKGMQDTKPILGYWEIRGLAQSIRYLLAYLEVEYTNKMYPVTDGPEFNTDAWFVDAKFKLGLDFPNLPYMIDGDFMVSESDAIMKYIATKWSPELLGQGTEKFATVQMLSGVIYDLNQKLNAAYSNPNKAEIAEVGMQKIKFIADFLADKQFLVGDITYVDFYLFSLCQYMEFLSDGDVYVKHPNLLQHFNRVKELPSIAAYMKSSDNFEHLKFNNKMAKVNN